MRQRSDCKSATRQSFYFSRSSGFVFYRAGDLKTLELIAAHPTLIRIVDFIIGAILGATMAHFVVDAGAWRLSQSLQRFYSRQEIRLCFWTGPLNIA